jgi:hypothetical protein
MHLLVNSTGVLPLSTANGFGSSTSVLENGTSGLGVGLGVGATGIVVGTVVVVVGGRAPQNSPIHPASQAQVQAGRVPDGFP